MNTTTTTPPGIVLCFSRPRLFWRPLRRLSRHRCYVCVHPTYIFADVATFSLGYSTICWSLHGHLKLRETRCRILLPVWTVKCNHETSPRRSRAAFPLSVCGPFSWSSMLPAFVEFTIFIMERPFYANENTIYTFKCPLYSYWTQLPSLINDFHCYCKRMRITGIEYPFTLIVFI